jgi:hypothetical protein
MSFDLLFTDEARKNLRSLESELPKKAGEVKKALAYLESNPRHPGLATHEYTSLSAILKRKVFEAYLENKTPGAHRIFWYYGPGKKQITIFAITRHP